MELTLLRGLMDSILSSKFTCGKVLEYIHDLYTWVIHSSTYDDIDVFRSFVDLLLGKMIESVFGDMDRNNLTPEFLKTICSNEEKAESLKALLESFSYMDDPGSDGGSDVDEDVNPRKRTRVDDADSEAVTDADA